MQLRGILLWLLYKENTSQVLSLICFPAYCVNCARVLLQYNHYRNTPVKNYRILYITLPPYLNELGGRDCEVQDLYTQHQKLLCNPSSQNSNVHHYDVCFNIYCSHIYIHILSISKKFLTLDEAHLYQKVWLYTLYCAYVEVHCNIQVSDMSCLVVLKKQCTIRRLFTFFLC